MLKSYSLSFIILFWVCHVSAAPTPLRTSPDWVTASNSDLLTMPSSKLSLPANGNRTAFIPEGKWLELATSALEKLELWQGQTLVAMRKVTIENFTCKRDRCQLPATQKNQFIRFKNISSEQQTYDVWLGHYHHHSSPFRQSLKLPLPAQRLSLGQDHQQYYVLPHNKQVTRYFPQAKKIKVTVRKDLHTLDQNGKVSVYINRQPTSVIKIANAQAYEYKKNKVSVANSDYIAVPKGSYLTIKSHGPALIKLEQLHRGIADPGAAQKYSDGLFNPYWINNLEPTFEQIYLNARFDDLVNFNFAKANLLERRRHQDLLSTISKPRFISPTGSDDVTQSRMQRVYIDQGKRKVQSHLYPRSIQRDILVHTMSKTLNFNWSSLNRVRNHITLFLKAPHQSLLTVMANEQKFEIDLHPNQHFTSVSVPLTVNTNTLSILSNGTHNVEIALQVDDLLPLPNSELLYTQPGQLKTKSPVIAQRLQRIKQRSADAFLNAITPYQLVTTDMKSQPDKQLSVVNEHRLLGNALQLLKQHPAEALPILKQLVSSPHIETQKNAWLLRVKALKNLNQPQLAKNYLEGLLLSRDTQLKSFAAQLLYDIYHENHNLFLLQGLCAAFYTALDKCPDISKKILLSQQKYLELLWFTHDQQALLDTHATPLVRSNFRSLSEHRAVEANYYQLDHHGAVSILGETSQYDAFVVSQQHRLTFTAQQDLKLQLRTRAAWQVSEPTSTQWLHIDTEKTQSIAPIYTDIASTARLPENDTRLSIASESIIELKQGQQLYLHSTKPSYVNIKVLNQDNPILPMRKDNVPFLFKQDFSTLIHDPQLPLRTLLINALWRLESQLLHEYEFTLLFAKLAQTQRPALLNTLINRIEHFGHWRATKHYRDYAGTQRVDIDEILKRSLAEQISRHSSTEMGLNGVLLRPRHTMNLDLSEIKTQPIKLKFTFAPTELLPNQYANVLISAGESQVLWPISPGKAVEYALNNNEKQLDYIALNWINPYASQLLSVTILTYQQEQWQEVVLDTKQLFYYATEQQPTTVKLVQDQLLKIETINSTQRQEKIVFHPAGILTLPRANAELARVYYWQLKPKRYKLAVAPAVTPLIASQPKLVQHPKPVEFIDNTLAMDANLTHVEGFMRYGRSGIFETNEPLPANHSFDIGIRLRNNYNQHWYRVEAAYSLNRHNYDTFSINGVHNWQDTDSHWFTETSLFNRWQDKGHISESQYAGLARFRIGETWRNDLSERHQWWWQPFYYHTSVDTQEYLDDLKINPSIFGFYRQDHMHGWQAEYEYRYQPWVDNLLSFGIGGISNRDWHTLDSMHFTATAEQYYQGQIFSAQLQSIYKFADNNRPNDTWQYLTLLSWQTLYDFSDETAGWVKLSWTQDWFNNEHAIGFEVNIGNLQNTGFTPFAHDEILFKSLQLSHFAEQDIYGQ